MSITTKPPEPQVDRERTARRDAGAGTFAERALRMGGKSADEARRTGALDAADEQVDTLFAPEYQTVNSPLHRAVWEHGSPLDLFVLDAPPSSPQAERTMSEALEVVRRRSQAGTIHDLQGKVRENTLAELAGVGYWGLLIEPRYGGCGAPFSQFAAFLTQMAAFDPTIAGLASVHGCIGAVDPVQTFGNAEQKARWLPQLASGQRLSGFALTEPCAGSDLTALRTTAVRDGDQYRVDGEKLFITNALPGRTIGLVCLVEDRPAVLVVDLPPAEDERFHLRHYGLYALRHAHNYGLVFRDFRVPVENLLQPHQGDGLTIAYHGLNRGRVSLCANAAGVMRRLMAETIPWVRYRQTYGEPIGKRELVKSRVARLAGLIVGCDALTHWCARLLDRGYRGEMECIVAKIFGSEALKEAAIEIFMKTHGGRSFLQGHSFGDNVHDLLAPCIYEGEADMLCLALFKSLIKQHAQQYFEPIGQVLHEAGIRRPNLLNPAHLWKLRTPLQRYTGWWLRERARFGRGISLPPMTERLRPYAELAADWLSHAGLEISAMMRKHQLRLADRQCRMAEMSGRLQAAAVILVTSLYAAGQEDEVVRLSGECLCADLARQLAGRRPTDRQLRLLSETGEAVIEGGFPGLDRIPTGRLLMPYANRA